MVTIVAFVSYNYFNPPPIPDTMKDLVLLKRIDPEFLSNSILLKKNKPFENISDFIYSSAVIESIVIKLTSNNPKLETNLTTDDISNYYQYLLFTSQQLKNFKPSVGFEDGQILLLKHNIVRLYSLIGTPQFLEVLKTYHQNINNLDFQELVNEQKSNELWKKYFFDKFGDTPYLQVYVQDSSYLSNISIEQVQSINSNIK